MLKVSLKVASAQHRAPRTIDGLWNHFETVCGDCRSIAELASLVGPRRPNVIVLRDHHAVENACGNYLRVLGDRLYKNLTVGSRPIPELTIFVVTCGPHAAIFLQH